MKSHITVTFSETNSADATHQVFTFKPSAKQTIFFAIKHSPLLTYLTLKDPYSLNGIIDLTVLS